MIGLAILGAILVGVALGLLGSGGSILTVPLLVYLVGQPEKVAITGSLAVVGGIALAGAIQWARRGCVDWRSVLWFGLPGMAATVLGAHVSRWIPGEIQLLGFATVMLVAAWSMAKSGTPFDDKGTGTLQSRPAIIANGLGVGLLTGLVGVGGGFLILPALLLLGGLPMHRAIGTSLWIIAINAFSGFGKHLSVLDAADLALDLPLLGVFILFGTIGSWVGQRLAHRLPQSQLRRGFAVLLVLMAVFIVIRELPPLVST